MIGLVGLSPYREHYTIRSALVSPIISNMYEFMWPSVTGGTRSDGFITRTQMWDFYPLVSKEVGRHIQNMLFSDKDETHIEGILESARSAIARMYKRTTLQ